MSETQETSNGPRNPHERKRPRYSAHIKVEIFYKGLEHFETAKTANISTGGLFICTEYPARIDDTLHLRIILSDKNAFFAVKARVAWLCDGKESHPQGLGVEFIELSHDQSQIIDKFLIAYVNTNLKD